jgi:hypothetical protein
VIAQVSRLARLAVVVLTASGCGASRLEVPSYPHPDGAPAEVVGFMPPPAQVEHLDSEPPAPGCLWADGQWVWAAQRWDWRPGAWIRPPQGCRYSPPTAQWAPSETSKQGVLYYRPGRWYSVGEPKACPEAVICPTESPVPQSLAQPGEARAREVPLDQTRSRS